LTEETLKILVADDHPQNQRLLKLLFTGWGYEAEIVSNGQEAFDKAGSQSYDLCVMDVEMPVMNGKEATKLIRQELRYLPILALSGSHFEKDNCLEAGADYFMEKPFNPDELHDKITELTIKAVTIENEQGLIHIKRETPMNPEHAKELRELEKQSLRRINLKGVGSYDVVVHKNVPNKISKDFIGSSDELSVFLDRSPDKPGECHLYRFNFQMSTQYLTEEEYSQKLKQEDEHLKDYTHLTTRKEK